MAIFLVPAVEEALKAKKISISTGRHLAQKALKDKLTHKQTENLIGRIVRREIQLKDLNFIDAKSAKEKPKTSAAPNFELKEDGSFTYPAIRFKPKVVSLRDIEKTVSNLEEVIKVLRKELKDRRQ